VYPHGTYADPAEELDILSDVAKGHVKAAMLAAFKSSSERHVVLHRKPEQTVMTTKDFEKPGDLVLVGFSNHVVAANTNQKRPPNAQPNEGAMKFHHKGAEYVVLIKPGLQYPKLRAVQDTIVNASPSCIVAYWGVRSTEKRSKVNVKRTVEKMQVTVGTTTAEVAIPILTNTCPLGANEELLLAISAEDEEGPPTKRHKTVGESSSSDEETVAKGARKGKIKASGKGKGKGKDKRQGERKASNK